MDYEKKYNEALNWMRELYPGLHGATKEDAEHYFPELRKSEDERITRAINNMLPFIPDKAYANNGVTKEGVLNWLEKQKEQKPAEEIKDQRQIYFMIEDGRRCGVIEGRKQVIDNPEEYGLQKPAEWSEEDERILYNVIAYVGYAAGEKGVKDDNFKEANEWLKNLRSQPHWKKSLATADLENSLCDLQDNYHDGSYEYKILGEAIEFIRCTELRPSWKPSEEQMEGLKFFLEFHRSQRNAGTVNWREYDAIESLYKDLRKL